jgi:hypothetical protein
MNLKTLISIKFVFIIIASFILIFLVGNVTDSYEKLEENNKTLLEQKKIYEQILKLKKENVKETENLYKIIEINNSSIESNTNNGLSIEANIWILIIAFFILNKSFDFLNAKIETLKNDESEGEKEKFL